MIRSLILKASTALACLAMVAGSIFVAAPSQAATISFSDPNCSSFSITGTAPNFTLVCASLACSIATNPSSPTPSQNVQFTANCSPAATSVTWTLVNPGVGCPDPQGATSNPMTLGAPGGTVLGCVYQAQAQSGGLSGQAQTTVSWSTAPPTAPSGCTLSASQTSLPIGGGTVTLTASCASGGTPTSYAWSGGGLPTPTAGNVASTSVTQTTTFSVTPSNASGSGNTASVQVNVAGTSLGNCGQYSNVLPIVTATWGQGANWPSSASGNFGDGTNSVWVFKLVVPPGTPNSSTTGRFTVSEFQGPTTFRQMTISATACDFGKSDYRGINGPFSISNGTTATVSYAVAAPSAFSGVAGLTAGQTYYINVRNWKLDPSPSNSCQQTTCNALMTDAPATP